jgi:hypothetical protein
MKEEVIAMAKSNINFKPVSTMPCDFLKQKQFIIASVLIGLIVFISVGSGYCAKGFSDKEVKASIEKYFHSHTIFKLGWGEPIEYKILKKGKIHKTENGPTLPLEMYFKYKLQGEIREKTEIVRLYWRNDTMGEDELWCQGWTW